MTTTFLPPLPILSPTGEAILLRSLGSDDTVADLSRHLGIRELAVDDTAVDASTRLLDLPGLRAGVRLGEAGAVRATCLDGDPPLVDVAVVSGSGVTEWSSLGTGRHLIGRAPSVSIRLVDPGVEPHHVLFDVRADGRVDVTQLSGSAPVRRSAPGGRSAGSGGAVATLRVGPTVVAIRRHRPDSVRACRGRGRGSTAPHPSDPWRRVVWRGPVAGEEWEEHSLTAPAPVEDPSPPSATGLIGVGATAIGAVVIASVLSNAMFLLFAAMGVVAAAATFAAGVVTTRRQRRRERRRHADAVEEFRSAIHDLHARRRRLHAATFREAVDTLCRVNGAPDAWTSVWERRLAGDEVSLVATIGVGNVHWSPRVETVGRAGLEPELIELVERCGRLDQVAVPLVLAPGDTVAVHGPELLAASVVRSFVTQSAVLSGPADWQLVVVSSAAARWDWTRWLPHSAATDGPVLVDPSDERLDRFVDAVDSLDRDRRTLLVTDEPRLFAARTGPLRRFLATTPAASAIAIVGVDATVPSVCRRTLTIGSTGTASWSGDTSGTVAASDVAFQGITVETADVVARRLACLVDPEDDGGVAGGVPATVNLAEVVGACERSVAGILDRWRGAGPDPAPVAPIGLSADGRVDIDLVRDGPHGLIAGTTGSGKSELLRTLVVSLALANAPEHLNFVLVDYKGGSTFDACDELPHTVGVVTDLDGGLAARALASLDAELHRRERLLRDAGAADLGDYRATPASGAEPIARLVVVIDEFAALARELPDFLAALVDIGRRGRSLGVHLLLATQRPAGVVNDDIRANTNLRLALRLNDDADALDVVGDVRPASFQRSLPGRVALRLGPDELVTFQSARCTGPAAADDVPGIVVEPLRRDVAAAAEDLVVGTAQRTELAAAVAAVCEAGRRGGHRAPRRPWTDPLPFPLHADRLDEVAHDGPVAPIGWIDDPAHQTRRPLTWTPGDGSLALIGSVGSGTTSTLIALATAICRASEPGELDLYVIDSRGDDGLDGLAGVAHCGGVVRLTEDERLHRLLARVVATVDRRIAGSASTGSEPQVVVLIDGLKSLRTSLGAIERQATFDLLARVLQDGPATGVALVVVDDDATAIGRVPVADRWVFHLDDPSTGGGAVPRAAAVGAGQPGRLRVASSGNEAQVARGAVGLASLPGRTGPHRGPGPIERLPERVVEVPPNGVADAGIEIGVDASDLSAAAIRIEPGDHVLVVGGPRTGVSNALRRIASRWVAARELEGEAHRVIHVDRRRPFDGALPTTDTLTLLVVDDAHRVDDPGILIEVIRGDHPHMVLVAGARADAVRTAYGHWTRELAKSRCGIVMTSRGDPDGDLLGAQIPRRSLVPARPGLGWIVDGGPLRSVQIAVDALDSEIS